MREIGCLADVVALPLTWLEASAATMHALSWGPNPHWHQCLLVQRIDAFSLSSPKVRNALFDAPALLTCSQRFITPNRATRTCAATATPTQTSMRHPEGPLPPGCMQRPTSARRQTCVTGYV